MDGSQEGLRSELWGKRSYMLKAALASTAFWLVQFALQYYLLAPGLLEVSFVRSFAFSGATLIGVALAIGPLANLRPPAWNFIEYRRTIGVAGFTFGVLHVTAVYAFYFAFDLTRVLWDYNPFKNPLLFGIAAFSLLLPLFLTSTDWAVRRLGYARWKNVHRLVYAAYVALVLHYGLVQPAQLATIPGYLLVAVTAAALGLQLWGYWLRVKAGRAGKGALVGAIIIALALLLFLAGFIFRGVLAA